MKNNPYNGIVLIDKNEGETSFDVVKRLRHVLNIKKVGHSGTLDPFATGLLIILLGQGTRLSPYLMSGEKRYRATMRLGVETDSLDPTGRVIRTAIVPEFGTEQIREIAHRFIGEIEQVPPVFSAVNYKGRRAYELARKGLPVELKKRRVKIHSLEVLSIDLPDVTMDIRCSRGTYIRSLAADMGKELGTVAHLSVLRRLSSGSFNVEDALNSKEISAAASDGIIQGRIIQLKEALPDMKEIQVDAWTADYIRKGRKPRWKEVAAGNSFTDLKEEYVKLVDGDELVSIMEIDDLSSDDKAWFRKMRVFH